MKNIMKAVMAGAMALSLAACTSAGAPQGGDAATEVPVAAEATLVVETPEQQLKKLAINTASARKNLADDIDEYTEQGCATQLALAEIDEGESSMECVTLSVTLPMSAMTLVYPLDALEESPAGYEDLVQDTLTRAKALGSYRDVEGTPTLLEITLMETALDKWDVV
ncbi:hypothetical protein ACTXJX_16315 [Glutamicibacter ardleyensis]|uniref:hypothetical protein n=1 Tax=Glutamicibacter ardleyensis TaxID=225894 RepID=UPI003FD61556